jgi:hypothetical protein
MKLPNDQRMLFEARDTIEEQLAMCKIFRASTGRTHRPHPLSPNVQMRPLRNV